MARPTEKYGIMLEKYRDVDEDEILSNLTQEELQQLEGEIDREVLNKIPEDEFQEEEEYFSPSDQYSSTSEEEEVKERKMRCTLSHTRQKNKSLEKQSSVDKHYNQRRRSSKNLHQFKVPPLRKTKSREGLSRQKSEEGEMKKELLQAVKQRTKKRTSRANSSGISRRYSRKNSCNLMRRRNPKVAKEEKKGAIVNTNFITQEMLSLRPKLKKVKTREPAKVNDMLHGVSLGHITSGLKEQVEKKEDMAAEEQEKVVQNGKEAEDIVEDSDPPADEDVAKANDNVHRRLNARSLANDRVRNEETMSSTTAGSTSAESYDVVGELSINPNSVEDTILRVWEDDENLTEVNLNNIQNVNMEVFEELVSAMECNTHVKHLCLANVGLTDKPVRALASMLKKNSSLEKLNVESNFITGDATLRLVAALRRNNTLTELRIDNQRHIFGAKVEHEFSKVLKDNKTLLRFGYQFANPGPRMAANNSLTRNMDDVRKKRMVDQRKRMQAAHANRPALRRQGSSEWYRKQKADRIQQLKDQGIPLNLQGVVQDEDVQKVLTEMEPAQYAMLEQWFISRLLGQSDQKEPSSLKGDTRKKLPAKQSRGLDKHVASEQRSTLKPTTKKAVTQIREPSPRDKLLESIRNQSTLKKRPQSRPSDAPTACSDVGATSPSICIQEAKEVPPAWNADGNPASNFKIDTCLDAASNGSDDMMSWREGDDYDSDEYEVVEIEVSESEESAAESDYVTKRADDVTMANGDKNKFPTRFEQNCQDHLHSSRSVTSEVSDDISDERSTVPYRRDYGKLKTGQTSAKEDAIKALDQLQIFERSQSAASDKISPKIQRSKKLSASPTSSSSSISSTYSPTTPRPVKDDDSWISSRPFYKLGAK